MIILRKNKILLLIISLFILLLIINNKPSFTPIPSSSITYKTILIDPGHGGVDTGAFHNEIYEKDINLAVSLILKNILISNGYNVILTRESDIALDSFNKSSKSRHIRDLTQRARNINNSNCEIFISIHVDSNPGSSASGPSVFYHKKFDQSRLLASYLQNQFNLISYQNYTPPSRIEVLGNYFILKNSLKPGVIVELGFITNPIDRSLISDPNYQLYIANIISEGINMFYTNHPQTI